jgi:hypothetical protein
MKNLLLALVLGCSQTAFAQSSPPAPVRIFVTSAAAEVGATKDFVRDLTEIIRAHKGGMKGGILVVAPERDGADLVLEFKALEDAAVSAAADRRLGSDDTAPLATFNTGVATATATLIVGASRKPMEATGSTATEAMERLARDVEAFARANAAKLRPPERD